MPTTNAPRPDLGAHLTFESTRERIDQRRHAAAEERVARLTQVRRDLPARDIRQVIGAWFIALGQAISPPVSSTDSTSR